MIAEVATYDWPINGLLPGQSMAFSGSARPKIWKCRGSLALA
jgi:hypothetical protein